MRSLLQPTDGCFMFFDHNRFFDLRLFSLAGRPSLFLDRDGTVNIDNGYTHKVDDLMLISGVGQAIARANFECIPVVLVTNQSGVGRGYYTWDSFVLFQDALDLELRRFRARIDLVLACGCAPFEPDPFGWRKPLPGMINFGCDLIDAEKGRSWMVGDQVSDIIAACSAGLRGGMIIGRPDVKAWFGGAFEISGRETAAAAIDAAIDMIIE